MSRCIVRESEGQGGSKKINQRTSLGVQRPGERGAGGGKNSTHEGVSGCIVRESNPGLTELAKAVNLLMKIDLAIGNH